MTKEIFVYMLIEAAILIIPIAAVFIRIGGIKNMIDSHEEKLKEFPEWKSSISTKVEQLELNDTVQNNTLVEINKNISAISAKMDLLLNDRIKLGQ